MKCVVPLVLMNGASPSVSSRLQKPQVDGKAWLSLVRSAEFSDTLDPYATFWLACIDPTF